MRKYETIYVLRPDLSEEAQKRVANRIIDLIHDDKGKVLQVDDWGTRKTAYPVQKYTKGHFVQLTYAGQSGVVGKAERILRILDEVMKFFSVKVTDTVTDEELQKEITWNVVRKDDGGEPKRRPDDRRPKRRPEHSDGA